MANYVTKDELREEVEVDDKALPDGRADRIIRMAEACVENALGNRARVVDGPQAGLLVAEDAVEPWQWERLKATILAVGRHLFENPDVLDGIYYDSVSGPDFSRSGGFRKVLGNEAAILFANTGLMPRAGRARP